MRLAPIRNRPALHAALLAALLAATWIYEYVRGRNGVASAYGAGLDVALWAVLSLLCLFLFAQFALPVHGLPDRIRLATRLWMHAWGVHGPVIFVENGRRVERRGEAARKGRGLVWIDTASAILTRTDAGPGQVLGPGIHFMDARERIEKTFSLHVQTYSVGPEQNEPVFERLPQDAGEEQRARLEVIQAKRQAVSGLTRDGNEVVPEIRVTFKLEGPAAPPGQSGTRFGFSSEAVQRAARGEGVNIDPVTSRQSLVAWNQLPGLIAVDLWREYLSKYTLDDLFAPRFGAAPDVIQPEAPPPSPAVEDTETSAKPQGQVAQLLWGLNNRLQHSIDAKHKETVSAFIGSRPPGQLAKTTRMPPGRDYTALQLIAHMVRERMSRSAVPILDESGRYAKGHMVSEEFKRLQERGIRILDVSLNGYRFTPAVEEQIVRQWKTAWLDTATGERAHVEQLEVLAAEAGRQRALLEHARTLGKALRAEPAASVPAALRALLAASHGELLTDERLRGRGAEVLSGIAGLAKWVESPDSD